MSRPVQARNHAKQRAAASRCATLAAALAILALSGCGVGGASLKQAEVDRTLYTSSVPKNAARTLDADQLSDRTTIRNAVSAADIDSLGVTPLPWANADTGARGTISGLAERKASGGEVCRSFSATRESFDGVRLYRGEACMTNRGDWRLQALDPT